MRIRKIALVVGLSIGLFATSQLLFAQTVNLIEVFGCRGDDTLEAGQFSGSKAVPSG